MDDDPLAGEPQKLGLEFEKVNNVPVCMDLWNGEICGLAGDEERVLSLIDILLLQLITNHGYDDVRIVFLLKDAHVNRWSWTRFLPHAWDEERKFRYMLCSGAMAHPVLSALFDVFKARETNREDQSRQATISTLPHYVFIIDDSALLEQERICKYLYNPNKDLGVSTIFTAQNKAYLPMNCKIVIQTGTKAYELSHRETGEKITFVPDKTDMGRLDIIGRTLAPLTIKITESSFTLPKSITLTQMYEIKRVEEVALLSKWNQNKTFMGMNVPIGARPGNELFYLDMHETGYGPHGLVAGTTGSGKSELLQSIIISLAANYHPHDVVFVLIDYKGGGMADVFQGMPHLVGTITNLGGNQTTRALISIKSELQRRQRVFSEHNVNNIDKYQKLYHKGGASIPIPHLIMIADEFAELKAEQPDFMKELVSAARVGRSLGVHLILATQKPAGVVDDQIWSNSKFKLCLKVQDTSDSNDVIKRPDAAYIKEPGRAYIQVGNDEVFEMFQSAYSGADYDPDGAKKKDKSQEKKLFRIALNGRCDKIYPLHEEKKTSEDLLSQLKAMVDYITRTASASGIVGLPGPWPPPLEEALYLDDILDMHGGFDYNNGSWRESIGLTPAVGILDNPREQKQETLVIDFIRDGNLFVYGMSGSGKTVFLQTLCLALAHEHSPQEVSIYVMDFTGGSFRAWESLPHIGGVMTIEEEYKINQFMLFMSRAIQERKDEFLNANVDSFTRFIEQKKGIMPAIVLMIDNYFALSESYENIDEQMMSLAREGNKYGIYLVATATNAGSVRYKFSINFKMAVAFSMTDKDEYNDIVGRCEGLEPAPNPGRALLRRKPPLEFQTANACFREMGTQDILGRFAKFVETGQIKPATPIPQMPDAIDIYDLNKNAPDSKLYVGLKDSDLQPIDIDVVSNHLFLSSGEPGNGKSTLLMSMAKLLISRSNVKFYLKDSRAMGLYALSNLEKIIPMDEIEDEGTWIEEIEELLDRRRAELTQCKKMGEDIGLVSEQWEQIIFIIDNLTDFAEEASDEIKEFLTRVAKKEHGMKIAIWAGGAPGDIGGCYEDFVKAVREAKCGVYLGSIKTQDLFDVRVPYNYFEKELSLGDGYLIQKNKYTCMRAASDSSVW